MQWRVGVLNDGLPWQEFLRLFFLGLQGTCVQPSMLIDIHPNWQRYLFKWATCNGLTTFWERFFVTSSYLNASDDSSVCACLRLFLTLYHGKWSSNHHLETMLYFFQPSYANPSSANDDSLKEHFPNNTWSQKWWMGSMPLSNSAKIIWPFWGWWVLT